jgi:hypothetical protein
MKWPGSTLTDSRSRYHGKNEREGGAEPGRARRLTMEREATREMVSTVARRVCGLCPEQLPRRPNRSRVGIWLGLRVFSKPDDNTGMRGGESL